VIYVLIGYGVVCLAIVALIARWGMSAKDGEVSAVRTGSAAAEECIKERGLHERTKYELDVVTKALAAANIRARALEEELTHALEQSRLGTGLSPADVDSRLLRLADRWREAAATRDPISARSVEPVPAEPPATVTAAAANLSAGGPIDVLR
jgi:hypothetical protein